MNQNTKVARAARKVAGVTPQAQVSTCTIGVGMLAVLYALLKGQFFTAAFGVLVVVLGLTHRVMAGNTKVEADIQRARLDGYWLRGKELAAEIGSEKELGAKV